MDIGGNGAGDGGARPTAGARVRLRDFSRSLPMSLLKAREAVMGHFRPSLHNLGITEQQWRVLRALSAVEMIEVMALAGAVFLLPPSLSRILKDLGARGLITRRTSEKDMRRGLVSISAAGRELIESAGAQSETIYAEITRRYGEEKLARLQEMLREIEVVLANPIEAAGPSAPAAQRGPGSRRGRPLKRGADKA